MKKVFFGIGFGIAALVPVIIFAQTQKLPAPILNKTLFYVNNVTHPIVEVAIPYKCENQFNIYRSMDNKLWSALSHPVTPIAKNGCKSGMLVDYNVLPRQASKMYYKYSLYDRLRQSTVWSEVALISSIVR